MHFYIYCLKTNYNIKCAFGEKKQSGQKYLVEHCFGQHFQKAFNLRSFSSFYLL